MEMDRLSLIIQLDLRRHCIETDIRKQYNQCLSQYFQSSDDRHLIEQRISLLKHALETLDFRQLRNKHPELCGQTHRKVFLYWHDRTTPGVGLDDTKVSP